MWFTIFILTMMPFAIWINVLQDRKEREPYRKMLEELDRKLWKEI